MAFYGSNQAPLNSFWPIQISWIKWLFIVRWPKRILRETSWKVDERFRVGSMQYRIDTFENMRRNVGRQLPTRSINLAGEALGLTVDLLSHHRIPALVSTTAVCIETKLDSTELFPPHTGKGADSIRIMKSILDFQQVPCRASQMPKITVTPCASSYRSNTFWCHILW